jgi:hypothetical protein
VTGDLVEVRDIAEHYRKTGSVAHWRVPRDLENALEVTLRNGFAERLVDRPAEEVCLRHSACSSAGMSETLALAVKHVLREPLRGYGAELGAGCGLLSSIAARSPLVQAILAVEVCAPQVELLIP